LFVIHMTPSKPAIARGPKNDGAREVAIEFTFGKHGVGCVALYLFTNRPREEGCRERVVKAGIPHCKVAGPSFKWIDGASQNPFTKCVALFT
jgi:hypothetical protein